MAFVFWFGVIYVVMTMVTRGSRRALDFVNALFELWIGRWNCKVRWSVFMETEFCDLFLMRLGCWCRRRVRDDRSDEASEQVVKKEDSSL